MNHTGRITRALGALALLAALLVGIPWALTHYISSPLPHDLPSSQQIHDTLTTRGIPDEVLLKALAIVVWITWALLVASLIAEAIGMARGTTTRRVPLASPFQPLARWLVTAIAVGILTTSTRPAATPTPALAARLCALRTNTPRAELVVDLTAAPPVSPVAPSNGTGTATVPPPAVYVVLSGDTLWDIAQQHLGDPYRWPEIYDLNQGRPQPDGTSLTDPNLIYPGWNLQLPAAAPAAADPVPVPAPTTPEPQAAPTAPPAVDVAPATVAPNAATETTLPSTPSTTTNGRHSSEDHPAVAETAKNDNHEASLPYGVAGSVIIATGGLGLLALLRRRQLQRRQVGHAVPRLSDKLAATETALRTAEIGTPGPWLDLALRALAAQVRSKPGEPAPQPVAAHLTADELVVMLAEPNPSAPSPWTTSTPGWRWQLPLSTPTPALERIAAGACAPMPALITIGASPHGPVMLDLDACGIVTITGTRAEARGLARSATLELAVSSVADELDIITVGDTPLVAPSATLPRVRHATTFDDAVALVARPAQATGKALDAAALATTFEARSSNRGADPWAPTILILDTTPDEHDRTQLEEFVGSGGRGLGVLAIGEWPDAPWQLHIADDHLDVPRLGLYGLETTIEAQRVEQTAADATVRLFEQTDDDTDELLVQYDAVDPEPAPENPVLVTPDAPITVHVYGPVHVDGATRPLTDLETELVTYLATRERPADADVIQTALWPDRTVSAKRWWNLISQTRKALGVDDDGNYHLPTFTRWESLRLVSGVTTDLACIEAALQSYRNAATDEAVQELTGVLDGVAGRPFDVKRGYAWIHANGLASYAEAVVTDAVHALAALCIERGDVDEALRVTTIGLRASPGNEILYRDLIIAHDKAGDTRAIENTMRDLLESLEATDPLSDLQPETLALYERVSGRARSKAPSRQGRA
jgi:DNA-binding SARP family transcriptional activator/LysM repeat protein